MPSTVHKLVYENGKPVWRKQPKTVPTEARVTVGALWKDFRSDGAAVDPSESAMMIEECARRGVPTHHDEQGRPVFTSKEHRRKYLKLRGFHDKSGYD
jgi:hypothetical protein